MGQKPSVAALALFETRFAGIEQAFTWIYEAEEGPLDKMAHPFIGCLPATAEFQQPHLPYLAADEDMERGGSDLDASKMICYICGQGREAHRDDDDDEIFMRQLEDALGEVNLLRQRSGIGYEAVKVSQTQDRRLLAASFKLKADEARAKIEVEMD